MSNIRPIIRWPIVPPGEIEKIRLWISRLDEIYDYFEKLDEETDREFQLLERIQKNVLSLQKLFKKRLAEKEKTRLAHNMRESGISSVSEGK